MKQAGLIVADSMIDHFDFIKTFTLLHDLEVQGNIVDHEYRITEGRDKVAEVSKKWFRVADTYGIEVAAGQDPALVLAIAAVVDNMTHKTR